MNCIKSNRTCTGYGRDVIFVNRTRSVPSSTALSAISEHKVQQHLNAASTISRAESELNHLFSSSSTSLQDCRGFRNYAVKLIEATYLPKSFKADASQGSFSWICHLRALTEPSKLLDTSLFAFSLVQLHITSTSGISLQLCLEQYNTALQILRSELADPDRRSREETLAAILVLQPTRYG